MNIKEDDIINSNSSPFLNRSTSQKIIINIVEKNDTLNISDQMAFEYNNQRPYNDKENYPLISHNHSIIQDSNNYLNVKVYLFRIKSF